MYQCTGRFYIFTPPHFLEQEGGRVRVGLHCGIKKTRVGDTKCHTNACGLWKIAALCSSKFECTLQISCLSYVLRLKQRQYNVFRGFAVECFTCCGGGGGNGGWDFKAKKCREKNTIVQHISNEAARAADVRTGCIQPTWYSTTQRNLPGTRSAW